MQSNWDPCRAVSIQEEESELRCNRIFFWRILYPDSRFRYERLVYQTTKSCRLYRNSRFFCEKIASPSKKIVLGTKSNYSFFEGRVTFLILFLWKTASLTASLQPANDETKTCQSFAFSLSSIRWRSTCRCQKWLLTDLPRQATWVLTEPEMLSPLRGGLIYTSTRRQRDSGRSWINGLHVRKTKKSGRVNA